MSAHRPSLFLRAHLRNYFAAETGKWAASEELVRQTLLRLRGAHPSFANDADVLPRALEIAHGLVVDTPRSTRTEGVSIPDEEGEDLALAMCRYADGDERALETIDEILAPRLFACFGRHTSDRAMTEELVRRTLLRLHATRLSYATASDILSCLFVIARRDEHQRTLGLCSPSKRRCLLRTERIEWLKASSRS
jgi:DNA-directed RNA polymerase specialized sigma24 family protein